MIAPRARETELPEVPARSDSQMLRFFLRYAYAAVATVHQPLLDTTEGPELCNATVWEGSKWFKPRQKTAWNANNFNGRQLSRAKFGRLGREITHDEPRLSVGVGRRDSWMLMKIHDIAR